MRGLPRRRDLWMALAAVILPWRRAAAQKPQPAVVPRWEQVPASLAMRQRVTVTLRVLASEDARHLTIRLLPTPGIEIFGRTAPRRAVLRKGQTLELPVTFRVVTEGTWTLGASVTNRQADDEQVSGAVLTIVAKAGRATTSGDSPGRLPNPAIDRGHS
jgi:hypothetical protein